MKGRKNQNENNIEESVTMATLYWQTVGEGKQDIVAEEERTTIY